MACEHYKPILPPVIVNRGTCSYCGEEMDLELLDSDNRCADCKHLISDPEGEECSICSDCNGSGEGQYDGTRCHYCNGRGTV